MRVLMTFAMNTEKANQAIHNNTIEKILESTLAALKPEAAYFAARNGKRTGFVVFDLADPSDMPSACEPLFQELGAEIDLSPVMDVAGVQSGLQKFNAR